MNKKTNNFLKIFIVLVSLNTSVLSSFAQTAPETTAITLVPGEKVWIGCINDGHLMPLTNDYARDFYGNNNNNQLQPLILTSKGQYVWSEKPYKFELVGNVLTITDSNNQVVTGQSGKTLAEVQKYVRDTYFPASGKMPDSLLFARPQYNTWIELTYNQNQKDVLKYAHGIIDNGLPAGVFMIDDTWQEDYGKWNFHPAKFPNPKAMIDSLHAMGFKVMLWICPFVSADQTAIYTKLKESGAFIQEKKIHAPSWESPLKPEMVEWWNGQSALLDFSNPVAVKWFNEQLDGLVKEYGVDGFKFDAGDMQFYTPKGISSKLTTPNEHSELYAQFGLRFPLNEYRACWKMGGQPLAQRLLDKEHTWVDLQKLIPNMILEGLCGYTFSCPDMIGGGMWTSFFDESVLNQDMVVRSAQCHALMPMMQFSVAPWRILDKEHLDAVKSSVNLRMKFAPMIMGMAKKSAKTGEPIITNLEYYFPNQGYETVIDQFMLGDKLIVAPMVQSGETRNVVLPKGKWKADTGEIYSGGKTYPIKVPLERLPYFELM